jgi:hypothetical protein
MIKNGLGFCRLAAATLKELKHQKFSTSFIADKHTYTTLLIFTVATVQ